MSTNKEMGNKNIIIGVTGHPASGKDVVADYLASKGFLKISGGDILREEMAKLGLPIDRSSIHDFVVEKRKERGNGYLSEETIKRVTGDTVISGVRNTDEVRILKEAFGKNFKLIAVETPIEIRFERAKERGRIGDDVSFDKFKEEEEKEKAQESGSHEVDLVIKKADIIIQNDGSIEELFKKIDDFIRSNELLTNGYE